MKKKILLFVLAAVCLTVMLGGLIVANATESEAATSIAGHNLSLDDNIRMIYYVDQTVPSGAETGVLCWLAPQETYTLGEEQFRLEQNGTQTVGGKVYAKYIFSNLAAKMMTVDVYAVSYVKVGDEVTYSSLDKYSVLQYCYNKKGSSATSGGSATLGNMVSQMLSYGATAQQYFNYRTDRLANATYYEIKVENGVLEDNTTHGLYKLNDIATLTASATLNDQPFSHWENGAGETVGVECTLNLLATESGTWTAVYGEAVPEPQPDPTYSQGLAFTSNGDGTCYVRGIGTCTDTDIAIPPVSPNGDRVTSIGSSAFSGCTSLTSVTIGNSVTSIGEYAFYDCTSLTSITVAEGNPVYHSSGNCLIETASKTLIAGCRNSVIPTDGSVTSIGGYAFEDCSSLTSVTIPDSVTSIGERAFGYCTSLTRVTIPDSVTSIGISAFQSCTSLTSVTIPDSVTNIGYWAFWGCTSLTRVTIPDSVTSIEVQAFYNCTSLTSVTIGNSVTSIGEFAFFECTSLTEIIFLGTEEEWNAINKGNNWDDNTGNYTLVFRPYSQGLAFTSNGDGTCYVSGIGTCTDTDIAIPPVSPNGDRVTSIGSSAFSGCASLTSVTIPDSVTSIGRYAFGWCTSLTSMTIPDSVTSIEWDAFSGCTSLTSVTIPDSVTSIEGTAFGRCTSLTSITVADGNPVYHSAGNCLIETASKTLIAGCNNSVIPTDGSVTSIGSYAFYGRTSLTSMTIPDSVTSIGYSAFWGCTSLQYNVYDNAKYLGNANNPYLALIEATNTSITSCTIHPDTKVIANSAFYNCDSLTSVTIGNSVTSIGQYAFDGCDSLTSVTIGNSVTSIGEFAFFDCTSLTSVTIPDSVTSIGEYAFFGCTSLTSVTFANTSGWYCTQTEGASSGTNMTVTNPSTNATNLRSNYYNYYWYRK